MQEYEELFKEFFKSEEVKTIRTYCNKCKFELQVETELNHYSNYHSFSKEVYTPNGTLRYFEKAIDLEVFTKCILKEDAYNSNEGYCSWQGPGWYKVNKIVDTLLVSKFFDIQIIKNEIKRWQDILDLIKKDNDIQE